MRQKAIHFISIIYFIFCFETFFSQKLTLKLSSKNKTEVLVLDKINYTNKHKDTISLKKEINRISDYLKNKGYLTTTISEIKKENLKHVAYFSLKVKIERVVLNINKNSEIDLNKVRNEKGTISIPIEKLQPTLSNISKKLDKEGKSFSKIKLENIVIKNKTVFADLMISKSKKRMINKIIIKGYENFPKSYLKNYFNLETNTIFNQPKLQELSKASKSLNFITEIKSPEVLFTQDSTFVYMYLNKKQNNSFDGLVNFASKENGDILFNGNIDLKLNNILNKGEKFEVFWNSIGAEKQEFKLKTEIPFILKSKFSPQIAFSIYKQDSTFLNTKFDSKLYYNVNNKLKLALTYSSESSETLNNNTINNIKSFRNSFLGFQLKYKLPKNDIFYSDKFSLEINPTFGKRKINQNSYNQIKIKASASYIYDLNIRNSVYIRSQLGHLTSPNFIDNELFRIGGAQSIRGFNEQSILAKSYILVNIEYRFLVSNTSFLYTITDIGNFKTNFNTDNLTGIGLGYLFNINKSQIKLSAAIGKNSTQSFGFKQNKIIISWLSYF
ncbi:MAG: ShlB/FhaC/HecB family hemolysin secretion/activation protein [Polaribacter sp.]|nr:hypothetical protein [Polaribacter sp.]MDG1193962.1 ShlB/FhaC/HecB family hemolysin secretion/activation protein [Polaribacter sp.]